MIIPKIGEVYYEINFVDTGLKIPRMEAMVFAGINLLEREPDDAAEGDEYFFQYAAQIEGSESAPIIEGQGPLYAYTSLGSFHTIEGAIAKIALVAAGADLRKHPMDWAFSF